MKDKIDHLFKVQKQKLEDPNFDKDKFVTNKVFDIVSRLKERINSEVHNYRDRLWNKKIDSTD